MKPVPRGFSREIRTLNLGDTEVEVTALVEGYTPARTNCSNEDATPAEGGGAEIEEVKLGGKDITKRLSPKAIEELTSQFEERVADEF